MRRSFISEHHPARELGLAVRLPLHQQSDPGFQPVNLAGLRRDDRVEFIDTARQMRDMFFNPLHRVRPRERSVRG